MSANNRNKISKELTLQEIIQKSTLRKNIDSISINETLKNKNSGQFILTNVKSVTSAKNNFKINDIIKDQCMISKNQLTDYQKIHQILAKNLTARTINSFKQTYNLQSLPDHNKNLHKDSQKSKQFQKSTHLSSSPQKRKDSSKSKTKKHSDYLCVKGSSGNVLNSKLSNQMLQIQNLTQFGVKNYQTLSQIPSQIKKKEKSTEFSTINGQNQQNKKHHSFMLTKYTTSNNFRQKSTRSIGSKKIFNKNQHDNLILPQDFINKKILDRGIKTQENKRVKINFQDQNHQQTKRRTKKIQIEKAINILDSPIKQNIILNRTILKSQDFFKDNGEQNQNKKKVKKLSPSKQTSQCSLKQGKIKGFKGTKVKSISVGQKIKPRYFIPDFLKPSLDLVMFDKKIIQVIKTQQNEIQMLQMFQNEQLKIKQKDINEVQQQDQEETDKKLQQLLLCMKAVTKTKKPKQNDFQEAQKQQSINKKYDENQEFNINKHQLNHKSKGNRIKTNLFENHEICGWEDQEKSNKKGKGKANKLTIGQLFDY